MRSKTLDKEINNYDPNIHCDTCNNMELVELLMNDGLNDNKR